MYQISSESSKSSDEPDKDDLKMITPKKKRKVLIPTQSNQESRKRKRKPELWQKNRAKRLRNTGESYVYTQVKKHGNDTVRIKKERPRKSILPPCGEKCRIKCYEKISSEQRETIFSEFYKLGDIEKQREYIASNMTKICPKYKYSNVANPRNPNNAFFFIISGKNVRVCKQFFMATLAINNRTIQTVLKKQNVCESGTVIDIDRRGKHGNHKKVSEEIKNKIRQHIDSIPRIEAHYCRANTTRQFIEGGKTLTDLHRDYLKLCEEENVEYGNYQLYSKIFNEEYNLSFHVPKKDQCESCLEYQNGSEEEKAKLKEKHEEHLREKVLSREEKENDKQHSANDVKVIVYDLQKVLPCPIGNANSFYYVSKLNVFNFTIFDIKSTEGVCYLWHEGEGLRGANEVGSCIFKYLKALSNQSEHDLEIIFYSDNCCGQNKNKFILALYLYIIRTLKIKSITHKFFIKGHSQNEGDSVHARIETEITHYKKANPIFVPDQYAVLIRQAKKKGKRYDVNELCFKDILDLKKLASDLYINIPRHVKFTNLRVIKLQKCDPNTLYYKYSFAEDKFMETEIINHRKNIQIDQISLHSAFVNKPTISEAKKKGLLELVEKKKCVPQYYLDFFKNL